MLTIFNQAATAQLQITLSASDYNGYHISCFGMQDGSITATANGGQAPYLITWSTGDTATSISALAAGYYRAYVLDANNQVESAEITLNEPELLRIEPNVFQYPNGYEISLYGACNGSITVSAMGGVSPYSYLWNDNNTTANRSALCAGNMYLVVTDANGCNASSDQITLRQPERSDWTMTGNSGSNSSTNFIGTTDNKDLVIKTNSMERMNVTASGEIKINSLAGSGYQMLYADSNGILKGGANLTMSTCNSFIKPSWYPNQAGNSNILWTCPDVKVSIGNDAATQNAQLQVLHNDFLSTGLVIKMTDNNSAGYTAINATVNSINTKALYIQNTTNINGCTDVFRVFGNGYVEAKDVKVYISNWCDYVFDENYKLLPIEELKYYVERNKHLPGIPSESELLENGMEMSTMLKNQMKQIEILTLYLIQQDEKMKAFQAEINELKNGQGGRNEK